ncbi:MAG: hypothetical protein KME35_20765 [Aphanocapsa sp. GSE-SYN-MK-11-07L]|jgi:uncharacterized protein YjbJ (UPF0337 family)|nr:hypothetical protein [Aphanocapsa sp. GSE-SYN-MK-11-07L]
MQKLTSWFRSLQLERVFFVVLAGLFLLANVACSNPSSTASGSSPGYETESTSAYRIRQEPQGGMNGYSDVDPRRDTSQADAKARTLIDRAEARIQDDRNPKEVIQDTLKEKPLTERAREFSDQVSDSTKNTAEKASQATKKGLRNLQQNTGNALDDSSDFVQGKVEDVSKSAKRGIDNAVDKVEGRG